MKLDCIGFGALNVDMLCRVENIAKGGEESYILSSNEYPGGSAANTIVGLARLGDKVGYIGKVSKDEGGRLLLRNLQEEKVDTRGVVISGAGSSGLVMGYVDQTGERALYVDPGVNNTIELGEIGLDYASDTRFLHLTSFVGEHSFEAQKKLLELTTNVLVSIDPGALYAKKGLEALKPILRRSYVVFPNEKELRHLTRKGPETGAEILLKQGVKIVAVKLGEKGCYITDGNERHWIDAYQVKVVDTTGAGDAFCAGFLHGLLKERNLYDCGRLGNLVASKKLTKPGAREGLPSTRDLINFH